MPSVKRSDLRRIADDVRTTARKVWSPTRRGELVAIADRVDTLAGVTVVSPPAPPDPSPPEPQPEYGLPYPADSYFRSRCDQAPVAAERTESFRRFMKSHPAQRSIPYPKLNVNPSWAMTVHVHRPGESAPVWKLTGGNTTHEKLAITRTQGFHMSDKVAATFPTGDQDRPGVMVDYEFGYTVQFADADPDPATKTIQVSNAGISWHGSNGLDGRLAESDDKRNFTSRGRLIDAMVIRRDLLEQAMVNGTGLGHLLHLYFVETRDADGHCLPMCGLESPRGGWGAEGERIRIAPDVDLEARGLTGAPLAIARTLQEHGAYLGDNSGSGTQIKAAHAVFYDGIPGMTTDTFKGKLTWDDFQVIPKGWK